MCHLPQDISNLSETQIHKGHSLPGPQLLATICLGAWSRIMSFCQVRWLILLYPVCPMCRCFDPSSRALSWPTRASPLRPVLSDLA